MSLQQPSTLFPFTDNTETLIFLSESKIHLATLLRDCNLLNMLGNERSPDKRNSLALAELQTRS